MKEVAQFRERLKAGRVCLGAGVTYSDPLVSDTLGSAVDFIWVDLEHGGMSQEAVYGHILAAHGRGVPALVRVAAGSTSLVKPVLDGGADGIIVPQVCTVEEVRHLVSDCRYPPLGRRGFGPRVPSNYFRQDGLGFVQDANQNVFAAVMIETAEALDALDEILAVKGLDSVVIGPKDLSWAIGAQGDMEHPKVLAAIETIVAKARQAGVFVGAGMGPDPAYAYLLARRGVQWLQMGVDCAYLAKSFEQATAEFKNLYRIPDGQGDSEGKG